MARKNYSSSSALRYFQPRYYIKRPKRFALLILLFLSLAWFVYDRQLLNREHQVFLFYSIANLLCYNNIITISLHLFFHSGGYFEIKTRGYTFAKNSKICKLLFLLLIYDYLLLNLRFFLVG
jgi:hypothetical protein